MTAAAPATSGSAQLQLLVNAARYCQTGDTGPIRPRLDPHAGLSVLDGRHRLRACEETGTPLKTEILDPSIDPFDYVLDANLHRRHLSEHAKVQVVQMVAKLRPHGGDHRGDDFKLAGRQLEITREQVSQQAGVNQAVVDRVRKIAQAPEPIRMASLRGDITLTDAVACIPFVAQVGRAWQRADPAPSRNPPVSRAFPGLNAPCAPHERRVAASLPGRWSPCQRHANGRQSSRCGYRHMPNSSPHNRPPAFYGRHPVPPPVRVPLVHARPCSPGWWPCMRSSHPSASSPGSNG